VGWRSPWLLRPTDRTRSRTNIRKSMSVFRQSPSHSMLVGGGCWVHGFRWWVSSRDPNFHQPNLQSPPHRDSRYRWRVFLSLSLVIEFRDPLRCVLALPLATLHMLPPPRSVGRDVLASIWVHPSLPPCSSTRYAQTPLGEKKVPYNSDHLTTGCLLPPGSLCRSFEGRMCWARRSTASIEAAEAISSVALLAHVSLSIIQR